MAHSKVRAGCTKKWLSALVRANKLIVKIIVMIKTHRLRTKIFGSEIFGLCSTVSQSYLF